MIVDGEPGRRIVELEQLEASMGPSMIVDGEHDGAMARRPAKTASMGPSMIVDGEVVPEGTVVKASIALQWGRR